MNKFIRLFVFLVFFLVLIVPYTMPVKVQAQEEVTELNILQSCDPPPPLRTYNVFYNPKPTYLIIEPLFWRSRGENKYYPWLATGYKEEDVGDFLKVTISLRKGVKWSDGKEFTALDVLTTFWCKGWVMEWWPITKYIDHMEAPDKYTVIIYIRKPPPLPWKKWFLTDTKIVSYAQYGQFAPGLKIPGKIPLENVDIDNLKNKLLNYKPDKFIGTGPYTYASESQTEWVYKLRSSYWVKDLKVTWKLETSKGTFTFGGGVPGYKLFDRIIWHRRISDPASWPLIMAGRFDFTWTGITETVYNTVKSKPGYTVITGSWLHGHALYFNCKKFPLKVRWAIAYAINREEYYKVAVEWGPESINKVEWPVAISPVDVSRWLPKDWLNKYIDKYEYNPEKAEQLLKEAGYTKKNGVWYTPEGKKFSLNIYVPAGWTGWVPGAENIATQLKKFGIDAKVVQFSWGMWSDTIRVKGDFDLAIDFWTYGLYHPFDSYNRFYVAYTVQGKGFHFNPVVEVPEGVSKYHGKVNATDLTYKLAEHPDDKELVKALAYITNHYLPALQMLEKKFAQTVHMDNIHCPIGWDVFLWYTPLHIEMGNSPSFVYGFIIASGLWQPKTSESVVKPTAAVPAGLSETVNATYKSVVSLAEDVSSLKSEIASLSDKIGALNSQLGGLTAAIVIEGIAILVLAVALIVTLRKPKK